MGWTYATESAAALVDRAKDGDTRAFEELVRRYRKRIVALTLHLTGSACEAEDVTQEVFLKAYRALHTFEGRSQFFTWLYRMAVNKALNARRSRQRRREEELDDNRVERAIRIDASNDPVRATELRQLYGRLLMALDKLPEQVRTSVVLVSLQGLTHEQAALIQECKPGTVAWRIHEARKSLRKALEPKHRTVRRASSGLSIGLTRLLHEWNLPVPEPAGL